MRARHETRGRRLPVAVGILLLTGCSGGPLGPIPGGPLDGPTAPVDGSWSHIDDAGIAEIETDPSDPYSVTIAYNVVGDHIYVNAGHTKKRWAANIVEEPNVRLRIDGTIYELRGTRVEDRAELAHFGEAWTQGWFRRDPTQFEEVYVFRLEPRPATASAAD